MTITMTVLACFLTLSLGFILGSAHEKLSSKVKVENMKYGVERIITLLQLKLVTENDHRGFQTRTQVSAWLKRMKTEVPEEIIRGGNHARKAY